MQSGGGPSTSLTTGLNNNNNPSNNNNNNNNNRNNSSFNALHFASFAAMEVAVTIIPRFTMPRVITLFGSRFGPFSPNNPIEIPLWLALHIRQTDACVIRPPSFLSLSYLRQLLSQEQASESTFEALPFYFFEVAKQLCENNNNNSNNYNNNNEDIPGAAEVVRLVAEIRAVRRQKLKRSMSVFEAEGAPLFIPGLRLTNIVHHELEYLRSSFAKVLGQSSGMKQRRERRIGGVIDATTTNNNINNNNNNNNNINSEIDGSVGMMSSLTPMRPSGVAPSLTATTNSMIGQTFSDHTRSEREDGGIYNNNNNNNNNNMNTPSMSGSPYSRDGYSIQNQNQSIGQDFTITTTTTGIDASLTDSATETMTNITTEGLSSPPVKKRRTLRQT